MHHIETNWISHSDNDENVTDKADYKIASRPYRNDYSCVKIIGLRFLLIINNI